MNSRSVGPGTGRDLNALSPLFPLYPDQGKRPVRSSFTHPLSEQET
jgi:hypothetical protein